MEKNAPIVYILASVLPSKMYWSWNGLTQTNNATHRANFSLSERPEPVERVNAYLTNSQAAQIVKTPNIIEKPRKAKTRPPKT